MTSADPTDRIATISNPKELERLYGDATRHLTFAEKEALKANLDEQSSDSGHSAYVKRILRRQVEVAASTEAAGLRYSLEEGIDFSV